MKTLRQELSDIAIQMQELIDKLTELINDDTVPWPTTGTRPQKLGKIIGNNGNIHHFPIGAVVDIIGEDCVTGDLECIGDGLYQMISPCDLQIYKRVDGQYTTE